MVASISSSLTLLLVYISLSCVEGRAVPADDVLVRTGLGAIRGSEQYFDDVRLRTFLGVPYAKKPTGIHRFTKPVCLFYYIYYIRM